MSGIMLNIDNSGFLFRGPEERMTKEGVDERLEVYSGTHVTDLAFCVAGRGRTRVDLGVAGWEPIWTNLDEWEAHGRAESVRNSLLLHERGIDPFARWLARTSDLDMKGWLSIRANDVHHTPVFDNPLHPQYWKDHPELWRRPYRLERDVDRGFDFGRQKIRDRLVRLVEALTNRYDMDGLEIDWLRKPYVFAPGHEQLGSDLVTGMMERIRRILDKAGTDIELAVRVPQTPRASRGFGLDAVRWAREGIVDRIAPCPDMHVNNDIPVDLWKDAVHGTDTMICPGLNILIKSYPERPRCKEGSPMNVSPAVVRGLAASFLHRGGDSLNFFNLYSPQVWNPEIYRNVLLEAGRLDSLIGKPRRHMLTYNDTPAPGDGHRATLPISCGPIGALDHRASARTDTANLRIYTGPAPADHERVNVRLAFPGATRRFGHRLGIPREAEVRVNGKTCTFQGPSESEEPTPREDLWAYSVPLDAMQEGYNMIETLTTRATTIEWAEIAFC